MEIISSLEVTKKLQAKAKGEYSDLIAQLPVGAALKIHPAQWNRRESVAHYFLVRFRGQLTVRKLDQCYYVIKKHPSTS